MAQAQAPGTGFYFGSRLLQPVCDQIGLSIDQVNYVACQLAAIVLGMPFRSILHPSKVSPTVRHFFELIFGLMLVYFCFGNQVVHPFMQAFICFIAMHVVPAHVHQVSFVVSIGYLAVLHIYRQVYDYGGYTLDITGPLMISTQKLSDLGFSLHDGMQKKEEHLNPTQLKYAQKKVPTILELMSYIFSFHNVMLGPTTFYQDYVDFITGKNIGIGTNSYLETGKYDSPSSLMVALKKVVVCVVCVCMVTQVIPMYPTSYFIDEEYLNSGFMYKMMYMLLALTLVRSKYYFGWTLSELTNVAAGFGFNGFKDDGSEDWDMIDNADIWGVETCTSMKINMDCWNIRTLIWLRRCVYERAPRFNTLAVFAVSAFWHGFYPGYYLAFATAALLIYANRSIRKTIRPMFQESSLMKFVYDVITFIGTRLCNVYMVVPMVLYELQPSLLVYKSLYFWIHILALAAVFFLPARPSSRPKTE